METAGHLIIGAECGVQIGTGHVMRCLALAQSWKRSGGSVSFLLPEGSPGIEQRVANDGFLVETLATGKFSDAVVSRMIHSKPRAAVLDGYSFGANQQATLSQAGIAVLTVDDYVHAAEYPVRWILNQNADACPEMYNGRAHDARLLLGPAYVLLRDEFSPWLAWERVIAERGCKILVTIGGSDPDNLSLRVLEGFADMARADLEAVVVVGASNPHVQALESAARRFPVRVRIVQNASDMAAWMAWADVAISGAGGTSYELAYMGLPSLLFVIAPNQHGVAEHLSASSVAVHGGESSGFDREKFISELEGLLDSHERRLSMSKRGRELVDGLGADRVRAALLEREMKLRPLRADDCELLFSWANDPAVRNASFHSSAILLEEHRRWFAQKLQDPQSVVYIAETCMSEAIGQARFHLNAGRATLSVVVAPKFRGTGWGRELVWFSTRRLARERSIQRVEAFVKPDNRASIRLFESAGFRRAADDRVAGQPALLFTWQCGSGAHAS